MKGNFHVQFLGEGVAATSPPYPTPGWATTQVYPAREAFGRNGISAASSKCGSTAKCTVQMTGFRSNVGSSGNTILNFSDQFRGHHT